MSLIISSPESKKDVNEYTYGPIRKTPKREERIQSTAAAISPLTQKNFGTPSKLTATSLRKRHLVFAQENAQLSASPIKQASQNTFGKYGKCEFSKLVIQHKKSNNITAGRNVAVIRYKSLDDQVHDIIESTLGKPGDAHAELRAYDRLPQDVRAKPENILVVYSERKPCTKGSNCYLKIKALIAETTHVYWSVDHPENTSTRHKVEAAFQKFQGSFGIRVSSRGKSLLNKFK